MKSLLILLLSSGFIAVAVFGFVAMHHEDGNHTGCIAEKAQGVSACAEENLLTFVSFHLETVKRFGTAILGSPIINIIFILGLALISGSSLISRERIKNDLGNLYSGWNRLRLNRSYLFKEEFNRWLALRENSPSLTL